MIPGFKATNSAGHSRPTVARQTSCQAAGAGVPRMRPDRQCPGPRGDRMKRRAAGGSMPRPVAGSLGHTMNCRKPTICLKGLFRISSCSSPRSGLHCAIVSNSGKPPPPLAACSPLHFARSAFQQLVSIICLSRKVDCAKLDN